MTSSHTTLTLGSQMSRRLFEKRGNHSEMHLSERELGVICDAASEVTIKVLEHHIAPDALMAFRRAVVAMTVRYANPVSAV